MNETKPMNEIRVLYDVNAKVPTKEGMQYLATLLGAVRIDCDRRNDRYILTLHVTDTECVDLIWAWSRLEWSLMVWVSEHTQNHESRKLALRAKYRRYQRIAQGSALETIPEASSDVALWREVQREYRNR